MGLPKLRYETEIRAKEKNCVPKQQKTYLKVSSGDRREVRMTQAEDSEHQRAIKRELEGLSEADRKRFEQIRAAHRERHGKETPEQLHSVLHTIRRNIYERQGLEGIKEGNFARFRDARLGLALLLEEEAEKDSEKLRKALATHLEVCYIDMNGPQESTARERERDNTPPFEPRKSLLTSGIVNTANVFIERLGLARAETKALFHKHNSRHLSHLNMPLSVDEGWNQLEPNLVFKRE